MSDAVTMELLQNTAHLIMWAWQMTPDDTQLHSIYTVKAQYSKYDAYAPVVVDTLDKLSWQI